LSEPDRLARAASIVEAAEERQAERIVCLDVRELSSFTDTFVIATGTSDRHVRSIAEAIEAALKSGGEPALGSEGYDEASWLLIDCGDTIVHLFQQETRDHYDLERLWSDAAGLDLAPEARSAGR
jgi:ribosome-associated protein